MSATLFVVSSPLQARHAGQYKKHVGLADGDCVVAFVKSKLERDNVTTREVLTENGFTRVWEFAPLLRAPRVKLTKLGVKNKDAIQEYAAYMARQDFVESVKAFFAAAADKVDRVVLGDYRPVSYRQFLAQVDLTSIECVLLDDGSVSQSVMEFRESKSHLEEIFRVVPLRPKFVGSGDPLRYPDPSRLTYFSIYSARLSDNDRIVKNDYYDTVLSERKLRRPNEVWIGGCNHVEANIASASEYNALIQRVRDIFPDERIIYFPHRREEATKIAAVAASINAEVRETTGLEAYILKSGVAPRSLVSFGSTVLDTVSRMLAGHTTFILMIPPKSYFVGSREEHVSNIIRANIRNNTDVVGLFSSDRFAGSRKATAVKARAPNASSQAALQPPAASVLLGKPDRIEGLSEIPAGDETLFLETPVMGLHRLDWPGFEVVEGRTYFRVVRLAGEGRSDVRLHVRLDDGAIAQCDLNLDADGDFEASNADLAVRASVHVDRRRRAIVQLVIRAQRDGLVSVKATLRPNATARSSHMRGNAAIGVSLCPLGAPDPQGVVVKPGSASAILQTAISPSKVGVIRIVSGDAPFDLVLHAKTGVWAKSDEREVDWAEGVGLLLFNRALTEELLTSAVPISMTISGSTLTVRSGVASLQIKLPSDNGQLFICWSDPYTGDRRVIEIASGTAQQDPGRWYRVAY